MPTFGGVWPALLTPFTTDNKVNVSVLRELVGYLIEKPVDGFYVCGTTGEGIFMPADQRRTVTETVVEQVNGRVPVLVHVGCVAVDDAVALAKHAQSAGADGVSSILPPLYQRLESLYAYFDAIGAAVPELPLFTYIFGGPVDAVALMQELTRVPSVVGAKYTGPNMHEFQQIVSLRQGNWSVFSGMDEQCLFAAMFGSTGNIGSTLNYIPGVYREIRACCEDGDLRRARDLQLKANRLTRLLQSFGFPGAIREVMKRLGFECGPPRLPNRPFPPEKRETFQKELDALDFSTLAAM